MKRIAFWLMAAFLAAGGVHASDSLRSIVESYVAIQVQLAADKIDDVKGPARSITAQAATMGKEGEDIARAANSLHSATDLKSARDAFGALTDAVMAAGKAQGWKGVEGVRLAFCPMVKRSWLQKEEQIRNPYYGSGMLSCGEFKKLKE